MKPLKPQPGTVSLCMIVKNEEKYLRDCLESVADVVDEVIVVDTGSTDNTVEIAREFNAKIYEYEWHDDFAAARNEYLNHATCDWIFHLDADERLAEQSKQEFKKWLTNRAKTCVSVVIDSPEAQHGKGHFSRAHRLFRNLPGVKYSGRIHEQISPSVQAVGGSEAFSTIRLLHLGYAKNESEMHEKSARNRRLLRKQIADEPENAYWFFTLAQNLILNREYDEAQEKLHRALELGNLPADIICSIHNNLAEILMKKGEYRQAIDYAQLALAQTKEQTTAHLLLFEIYGYLKNADQQIGCLEAALAVTARRSTSIGQVSVEAYVEPNAIRLNLAHKYRQVQRFADAKETYLQVLTLTPDSLPANAGLGECFFEQENFAEARQVFEKTLSLQPDDIYTREKLGWVLIKLQKFPQAISVYEKLLNRDPANHELLRRVAGLYKVVGNVEKAREYLQRANK